MELLALSFPILLELGVFRSKEVEEPSHYLSTGVLVRGICDGRAGALDYRVHERVGDSRLVEFPAEGYCLRDEGGPDYDGVRLLLRYLPEGVPAGVDVELVVEGVLAVYGYVGIFVQGMFYAALDSAPVFAPDGCGDGYYQLVGLFQRDGGGVYIVSVPGLREHFLHRFPAFSGNIPPVVKYPVHRAGGYPGHLSYILYLDLPSHKLLFLC